MKSGEEGTVHWMKDNFVRFSFFKIKFGDVSYENFGESGNSGEFGDSGEYSGELVGCHLCPRTDNGI